MAFSLSEFMNTPFSERQKAEIIEDHELPGHDDVKARLCLDVGEECIIIPKSQLNKLVIRLKPYV